MARKMREGDIPDARLYAGKVKRLAIALIKHGYTNEEALAFIASARGVLDSDKKGLAEWFGKNLPKLSDNAKYREICEDCACCLGGKRYEAARAIFLEEPTLEARVARLLKTPLVIGCRGNVIDKNTFEVSFFPEQEYYMCSCLRFKPGVQTEPMPKGYCYCCCGHLKHHIQKALGHYVEVELITSSLITMGKEGCRFRVRIAGEIK